MNMRLIICVTVLLTLCYVIASKEIGGRVKRKSGGRGRGNSDKECDELEDIPNGHVSYDGTTAGTWATYTCDDGFQICKRCCHKRKCKKGRWTGREPYCVNNECGEPKPIDNGQVSSTGTTLRSVATYTCNEGYELSQGSSSRRCKRRRGLVRWSGRLPRCIVKSADNDNCGSRGHGRGRGRNCGELEAVDDAEISYDPDTLCGGVATYTCNPGFELCETCIATRTCVRRRQWNGVEPMCDRKDCGTLTNPDNGDIDYDPDTKFEATATYSCDTDYRLDGDVTRICEATGAWSGTGATCVLIDCGDLSAPANGAVSTAPNTNVDGVATFSCDTGYFLDGDETRTCLNTGTWGGSNPTCVQITCQVIDAPDNGQITVSATPVYGDIATYTCNDNSFRLVGDNQRVCGDANGNGIGQWSGDKPSCDKITCSQLSNLTNGILTIDSFELGGIATYVCDDNTYCLSGDETRTCQLNANGGGSWDGDKPSCNLKTCTTLSSAPDNGFVHPPVVKTIGSITTYSCEDGFELSDNSGRTCIDDGDDNCSASWDGSKPTCSNATIIIV